MGSEGEWLLQNVVQEGNEIDLSARSAGLYLLRITDLGDGSVGLAKVIVQH
ncbi:MAG: T9SS type A sorting domain-containing protein [Saprospiraceae bacterium]